MLEVIAFISGSIGFYGDARTFLRKFSSFLTRLEPAVPTLLNTGLCDLFLQWNRDLHLLYFYDSWKAACVLSGWAGENKCVSGFVLPSEGKYRESDNKVSLIAFCISAYCSNVVLPARSSVWALSVLLTLSIRHLHRIIIKPICMSVSHRKCISPVIHWQTAYLSLSIYPLYLSFLTFCHWFSFIASFPWIIRIASASLPDLPLNWGSWGETHLRSDEMCRLLALCH